MIRELAVFLIVNITLIRCSEIKIPKNGIFLFLTEEGEHCFRMLSIKARKAFGTVREIKNTQMRMGNFSAFDFHLNLYKISPEAALCYLEMSYSINDEMKKMDEEAADFIRLMKASYIDGPWSAYERLLRVTEVPRALKSLSDTARSQIYKAFPNFKTLSNGNPRDQSAQLMRQIYSNRG